MNLAEPLGSDDCTQFFKEERTVDCISNVFLKKVRYNTPNDELIHRSVGDVSLLQWSTIEVRVLKAATVQKLVENLSSDTGEIDSTYVNVFLATYRAFSNTKEVLTLLLDRYVRIGDEDDMKQGAKEAHRKSIRIVISVWLDAYPEDFREPPSYPCLRQLQEFARRHMEISDLTHRAQHRMEKFRKEEETPPIVSIDDIDITLNFLDNLNIKQEPNGLSRPVEFDNIPELVFAEQLTYIDAELFRKVVPHHCLGCVWSRRDKKRSEAPSVYATVNQFNAVSYRVIATVLKHPMDIMRLQRARIIEKWIEIAQELRFLKNFTSLWAIISGLKSSPVHRLEKTWAEVNKESLSQFEELANIFSEENNLMNARELLMKEGTAKFADSESTISKRKRLGMSVGRKKGIEQSMSVTGTIPYLGTFLTDLTMIDAAIPDYTEDNLINFEKRRKEFELLAQIKLLQSSATMYQIKPDFAFMEWFHSMRIYDDSESHELSYDIEPPTTAPEHKGHRKKSSLGFFTPRRPANVLDSTNLSNTYTNSPSSTPSVSNDGSIISEPSTPLNSDRHHVKLGLRQSISMGSLKSEDSLGLSPWRSPETCVAKVYMEVNESHQTNLYKSILINNSDHTKNVIRTILMKFDLEGEPEDYKIYQDINDKEMQLPDRGNIFYAINSDVDQIKFFVRKKADIDRLRAKQQKRQKMKNIKLTL